MTHMCVYIINAENTMPKPYLYTYVREYAHSVDLEQYLQYKTKYMHTHTCTYTFT